jgi:hypothetical protein
MRRSVTIVVMGALLVLAGPAAGAHAASETLVSQTSVRGAFSFITQSATCPAGTFAVAAGADVVGGLSRVALLGTQLGTHPTASASTHGDQTFVNSWGLITQGICSTEFTNAEHITSTSLSDSSQEKIVTASCDSGRRLLSTSASITGSGVLLEAAQPDAALTSATAIAIEDEAGTAGNWSLTLYAYCATPPPGLQLVTAETPLGNSDFAQATATCPAGKHVIGTGHRIFFDPAEVLLHELSIDPDLSHVRMTVFEDQDGASVPWQAAAYAICWGDLPTTPPPPATTTPPAPPPLKKAVTVKLAGAHTLTVRAGKLSLKLACPKGATRCKGTAALTEKVKVKAGTHQAKTKNITLATKGFSLAGGKTGTVKLTLRRAGRSALARAKHHRLHATLTIRGTGLTGSAKLTLRAAARKH